jgi:hypothetical protein
MAEARPLDAMIGRSHPAGTLGRFCAVSSCEVRMGSVIKKRRKRMAKKKHRKLLKKTRVQRRNKK